ncbi:MAG: CusA/CzcA family heavy metal efflux RND transporter [Marinifilaceae bacterium]
MFKDIIRFCIKNKLFVLIGVIALLCAGIYATVTLPTDAVPDITNNQVQIVTVSPTLAPQEVERLITFPVEINMSNILDVQEIRSISRFGLSVVTVVFADGTPILDARQLINEQLQAVAEEIPSELGTPQMMPITTGLGEIYQYTLGVKPGYEEQYSIMDLRTIQDWIVKRQLAGIPGIVEISSFGGDLKQYEVAVDPAKMRALDITIDEVYTALEDNNQNTGGSYIEKYNKAYYIRSEGMIESIDDISDIVVANRNGLPVYVRDIGIAQPGSASRFGAMTKNGQGETVGGITLMLKGANASQVTHDVKQRVQEIQSMLPEGVFIEPYLIRSELVERNMNTVIKNLVEGAIIVLLVLMLFLGNIRVSLIVASIIPLAMLFAFILMRLFGVSANLMSLGAIDFGIVIDGTIILVESAVAALFIRNRGKHLTQKEMDHVIAESTGDIAKSAVFSVLIILIVFFPILTLTGIEGKTFTPMAKTLIFAIVGALILSLTYIPVMLSMCVRKNIPDKENFSDKMMARLQRLYAPVLNNALRHKVTTLTLCVALFAASMVVFMRMGGEFMPVLDEGDFAMQMTLPPGSSLSESIEIATRAEKVLMNRFPEIKSVVSKIGTAEVPTDPMGVEDADIMIVMHPREMWTSATTRAELVDKMKQELEVVTGAEFNFSQPIQLRFNELMTGSKADIAVKLYGEDMEVLYQKANEAAALIEGIEGPSDIIVEQVVGLPQLVVNYNRKQLARHGLSIKQLNTIIRTAYAGETAGVVFEGERRFDLVVRYDKKLHSDFNINDMSVRTASGALIPLSEVAKVEFIDGPMQINRDATKRRISIGINVRNADVERVVYNIQEALQNMELPAGYYFTYGGQFENLKNAKQRLAIVVPVALMLILLLLFFTFNSMKYALLIFSSIPLSVTGGIFALALRDIPFSISAGVGFIALCGVAVLNGIVMINHYKHMSHREHCSVDDCVTKGSLELLRPVLMTGLVASLGFLPMAISNSAGSEMQRPLATVVIGGLIISTILTLLVIPILYKLANSGKPRTKVGEMLLPILVLGMLFSATPAQAQQVTLNDALREALEKSPRLKNAQLGIQSRKAERGAITGDLATDFSWTKGQINDTYKGDAQYSVTQSLGSLLTPFYENKLVNRRVENAQLQAQLVEKEVVAETKRAWFTVLYQNALTELYRQQADFAIQYGKMLALQHETGAVSLTERLLAETRAEEMRNRAERSYSQLQNSYTRLKWICMNRELPMPTDTLTFSTFVNNSVKAESTIYGQLLDADVKEKETAVGVERSRFFPQLSGGYTNHRIADDKGLQYFEVGVSMPLWFVPQRSKVKQAKIERQMAQNTRTEEMYELETRLQELNREWKNVNNTLGYYHNSALKQAAQLMQTLHAQRISGDTDVTEFLQGMLTVTEIREGYLDALLEQHIVLIELEMYR